MGDYNTLDHLEWRLGEVEDLVSSGRIPEARFALGTEILGLKRSLWVDYDHPESKRFRGLLERIEDLAHSLKGS